MRNTLKVAAGVMLAAGTITSGAQAQSPDIRLLGYNTTLSATCNIGCSQLMISLMLGNARATDNTGAAVPSAIAAMNAYLRNATFQIFGTNPTITSVSGVSGSFMSSIDNGPANFGAVVLNDQNIPLTSSSISFLVNLAPGANVVSVSANGLAYVDPNLNFVNSSGVIVPVPPALSTTGGPYYQTGDFNIAQNITTSTPEPSTYALMATGLVGLVGFARRRRAL